MDCYLCCKDTLFGGAGEQVYRVTESILVFPQGIAVSRICLCSKKEIFIVIIEAG